MLAEIKKDIINNFPFIHSAYAAIVTYRKHQSSRRKIRCLLKDKSPIFLEVGAGDKKGESGWVTIDISQNCDIFWDMRNGLPFPDESINKIYSSHFLEHLSFKEAQQFLDECRRVLIPGGTFSICVPNARLYIEAYLTSDPVDKDKLMGYKPACDKTTRIDLVNYIAYMDSHHKYMFDEENLIHILISKGFKDTRLREFDPSLDLKKRDFNSIYAETVK